MSDFFSQGEVDELVKGSRKPVKECAENSKSKEQYPKDYFSKKIKITQDFFDLTLACFNNLIATGNIYLAMKKFCETKKQKGKTRGSI